MSVRRNLGRGFLLGPLLLSLLQVATPPLSKADAFDDFGEVALEDLLAEPVVETATLRAQRAGDVPGTVFSWTGEELEALGVTTVEQALGYILGAKLAPSPDRERYSFRELGDGLNSKILFLIDGIPANDPASGGFIAGQNLPLDEVRKLEIVLGPGSALYGANAYAGVVHLLTKRPRDQRGWSLRATTGTEPIEPGWNAHGATVAWSSGDRGAASFRISGHLAHTTGADFAGSRANPATPADVTEGNADWKGGNLSARLQSGGLDASLRYHGFESGAPGLPILPTPLDRRKGHLLLSSVEEDWRVGERSHLLARLAFQEFRIDTEMHGPALREVDDALLDAREPLFIDTRDGIQYFVWVPDDGLYRQADLLGRIIPGGRSIDPHGLEYLDLGAWHGMTTSYRVPVTRVLSGSRWQSSILREGSLSVGLEGVWERSWPGETKRFSETNGATYGQVDLPWGVFRLIASGRVDRHSVYGTFSSPRVALVAHPAARTRVRVSASRAFRAPTTIERHLEVWFQALKVHGKPELEPERIEALEGSIEQGIGRHLDVRVNGFAYSLDDEIRPEGRQGSRLVYLDPLPGKEDMAALVWTTSPTDIVYVNDEDSNRRAGAELTVSGGRRSGLAWSLGTSVVEVDQRVYDDLEGRELRDRRRVTALLGTAEGRVSRVGWHTRIEVPSESPGLDESGSAGREIHQFWHNWSRARVDTGLRLCRGRTAVDLTVRNILGSDRLLYSPATGGAGTASPRATYEVDEKPYWTLRISLDE